MRIAFFLLLLLSSYPADAEWMQRFMISKCVKELSYFEITMGAASSPDHIFQRSGNIVPKIKAELAKQGVQIMGKKSSYICSLPSYIVKVDLDQFGRVSISVNGQLIVDHLTFAGHDGGEQYVLSKIGLNVSGDTVFIGLHGHWTVDNQAKERWFTLQDIGVIDSSRMTNIVSGLE